MKKDEAMQIAPERSELLCEYITQILSDTDKVSGEIRITSAKIDNEKMIVYDISVPSKDFEKHLNTGITTQHIDVLTEQILNDLVDNYLESETMGCTKYYTIRGMFGMNMDGVSVVNSIGSNIKINFMYRGQKFLEQVEEYNAKLDAYLNRQNQQKIK